MVELAVEILAFNEYVYSTIFFLLIYISTLNFLSEIV